MMNGQKLRQRFSWAVVISLLGMGAWYWVTKSPQESMEPYLKIRAGLSAQLTKMVANKSLLAWAARYDKPGNQELAACIQPDGVCRVTTPEKQEGFFMPTRVDGSGELFSGTPEEPANFYADLQQPCVDGCQGWQTITTFWADCQGQAETCQEAEQVHVRVLVRPHPDRRVEGCTMNKRDRPIDRVNHPAKTRGSIAFPFFFTKNSITAKVPRQFATNPLLRFAISDRHGSRIGLYLNFQISLLKILQRYVSSATSQ
jgi:hypothetical protein